MNHLNQKEEIERVALLIRHIEKDAARAGHFGAIEMRKAIARMNEIRFSSKDGARVNEDN